MRIRMFSDIGFKGNPMKLAESLVSHGGWLVLGVFFFFFLFGIWAGADVIFFLLRKL